MYRRTIWQDHVEGVQDGTDLNAANLNNIEAGIMESNALAALHTSYRRYESDVAENSSVYTQSKEIEGEAEVTVFVNRNNNLYNVTTEISNISSGSEPATNIIIYAKQAKSFKAKLSNPSAGKVSVTFHIVGGMR